MKRFEDYPFISSSKLFVTKMSQYIVNKEGGCDVSATKILQIIGYNCTLPMCSTFGESQY